MTTQEQVCVLCPPAPDWLAGGSGGRRQWRQAATHPMHALAGGCAAAPAAYSMSATCPQCQERHSACRLRPVLCCGPAAALTQWPGGGAHRPCHTAIATSQPRQLPEHRLAARSRPLPHPHHSLQANPKRQHPRSARHAQDGSSTRLQRGLVRQQRCMRRQQHGQRGGGGPGAAARCPRR